MTKHRRPRHANGEIDRRYTFARVFCGYAQRRWVTFFCGEWLGSASSRASAIALAHDHRKDFCCRLGIAEA